KVVLTSHPQAKYYGRNVVTYLDNAAIPSGAKLSTVCLVDLTASALRGRQRHVDADTLLAGPEPQLADAGCALLQVIGAGDGHWIGNSNSRSGWNSESEDSKKLH